MENKSLVKIAKINDYIEQTQKFVDGYTYTDFLNDDKTVAACVFCLSQIGELANRVDVDIKQATPDIPWYDIVNMRHHIIHDYEGIDFEIIWDTINNDLPVLYNQLSDLQHAEAEKNSVIDQLEKCALKKTKFKSHHERER